MNSSNALNYPNAQIREVFGPLSIDKRRLPSSGLTAAGIPSFVAEWLLDKVVPGSGSLTPEELIQLNEVVAKAFPRKDDKNEILFYLSQGKTQKLIALMQVRVKLEKNGSLDPDPIAKIPILSLENCPVSIDLIERNKPLLRNGIWGKITLVGCRDQPVEVIDFEPFQCSTVNLDLYAKCRSKFTLQQWQDLMLCSMGLNPEHPSYTAEAKTWMLARLIPLVERNYHIMELAPKGTGKSFIFENINSKVALISGGKVTPAQLLFNGRTKEVGLLGRYEVLVLDEVQSLTFDNPDEVIGPLKNYLASGRYNRSGFAEISSDCSLVMLANIQLNEYLRPHDERNLIGDLPEFFSETAFLDRIAGIIPGWEIPKFKQDMIASQIGLKMDFFGEALLALRHDNRFYAYAQQHTQFNETTNIRDQTAICKSAAGFLKILYPHLVLTVMDYERDCLKPAIQLRQFIRNALYNLDAEFRSFGEFIEAEAI